VLTPLALIPAVVVCANAAPAVRYAFEIRDTQARISLMGHYLREVLPKNAAVITELQGGAIAHYTEGAIVRLDLIPPGTFDVVLDDLLRYGYRPVLLLDEATEAATIAARLAESRLQKLDWPPRAVFRDRLATLYLDPVDREAYHQGKRWPVDVVRVR
jgi:hypothetical protein